MRYVRTYFVTSHHVTSYNTHHRISQIFFLLPVISFNYFILFKLEVALPLLQRSCSATIITKLQDSFTHRTIFLYPLSSPSTFYPFFSLFISLHYLLYLPFSFWIFYNPLRILISLLFTLCSSFFLLTLLPLYSL